MDPDLLVMEQIEVGAEFLRRLEKNVHVGAAFWLKASVDERWYLYVASPEITRPDIRTGYGALLQAAGSMPAPRIDPFRVKFVTMDDPLIRAALNVQQLYLAGWYRGGQFGGVSVEAAYFYPLPVSVAS